MSVLTKSWRAASLHCSPASFNAARVGRRMRRRATSYPTFAGGAGIPAAAYDLGSPLFPFGACPLVLPFPLFDGGCVTAVAAGAGAATLAPGLPRPGETGCGICGGAGRGGGWRRSEED